MRACRRREKNREAFIMKQHMVFETLSESGGGGGGGGDGGGDIMV
jgi:hypothetical protein